ncbi:phosphotransferase family protein [Desertibaculum subflavum]|uniref:phosphotransferase family protein n=1 Tax=Desertibaculum subflavum TaxID=2268458 RepID=UPI000E664652
MLAREEFAGRLEAALGRHLGAPAPIGRLIRLTGGATKATWSIEAGPGGERRAFVAQFSVPRRVDAGNPMAELPRVLGADDAACMIAAAAAGVPAPPVRAVFDEADGLGAGYLMDRVEGETIARRVLREAVYAPARGAFAAQCGTILARLHTIPPAALPFLIESGPAQQVDLYRRIYRSFDHPVPALELGFRWAEEHLPADARTVVTHGDFRFGNLIFGPDGVRAVIDWEICHLGDPVEDLGWLCVRTWRFGGSQPVGGMGRREDLLQAYARAGGATVAPAHLRFWEGFGCLKWAVMCMMKGQAYLKGGERTVEALAIGRRMEEPLADFYRLLAGED